MTGRPGRRRQDERTRAEESGRSSTETADGGGGGGSVASDLQQRYGNQAIRRLVESGTVQLKPSDGRTDSPAEREAETATRQQAEQTEEASETLNDRVWAQIESKETDWKSVVSDIESASEEERTTLANRHKSTVHVLRSKLSRDQFTTVCDALFEADPDRLALRYLVEYRFDVKVGTEHLDADQLDDLVEDPDEFGPEGLERIYEAYSELPASHVEQIEVLVAGTPDMTGMGDRKIAGAAHRDQPWVAITYDEKHADREISLDNKFEGENELAQTATHEVGEQVYDRGNFDRQSFLEVSGWQRRGARWTLDDLMEDTGNELQNTDFQQYLATGVKNRRQEARLIKSAAKQTIREALDDHSETTVGSLASAWRTEVPDRLSGGRNIIERGVTGELESMDIVQHVVDGHPSNEPWDHEPFRYLDEHQYHLPYTEGVWMRYETQARTDHKVSDYQFRGPNDEFAELYALYFMDKDSVPKPFRTWFEREVDPQSGNSPGNGGGSANNGGDPSGGGSGEN